MKYFLAVIFLFNICAMKSQSLQNCIQLFKAKKITEAQYSFESYLKQNPKDVTAIEYLGDIAFQQKKWSSSACYFKQLVKLNPEIAVYNYKYAGALGMKAKNNKLKALFLIDDIKFYFKKAAQLDLKYVEARLALMQLYSELPAALGGSKEKAKQYAEEIKELDPKAYAQALEYLKG